MRPEPAKAQSPEPRAETSYAKKSSTRPSLSPKVSIRLPYWFAIASQRLPTGVCFFS